MGLNQKLKMIAKCVICGDVKMEKNKYKCFNNYYHEACLKKL